MSGATQAGPRARPILFSGPMVRAILAGRKTQTRRIVKPQPYKVEPPDDGCGWRWEFSKRGLAYAWNTEESSVMASTVSHCPYGVPGDRLWVREAWCPRSDLPIARIQRPFYAADPDNAKPRGRPWTPSIHMPRWASRITLEITGVRVERLQAIGEQDAYREGIPEWTSPEQTFNPIVRFADLWDAINGKRPDREWAANPWVWVVEFEPEERAGT